MSRENGFSNLPKDFATPGSWFLGQDRRYVVAEERTYVKRGTSSKILKAFDLRNDMVVAVKTLEEDAARDINYRSMLFREGRAMSRFNHPNIVKFYDLVMERKGEINTPHIIMEFVDGESLLDRLRDDNQGPMTPDEIIDISFQMASALDYIHKEGATHGDVKPNNILKSIDGAVKLTDFANSNFVSLKNARFFSPGYSAPEMALDRANTPSTDLFSFVATVYALVHNALPPDVAMKIEPQFLDIRRYEISNEANEGLKALFRKGMAFDPSKRFYLCSVFANRFANLFQNAKNL